MEHGVKISIIEHFKGIYDPRRQPMYLLHELFTIIICATIAGADDIVGIVKWANNNKTWLEDILELSYGIPSHDTIGRVLSIVSPQEFERCFINWTNAVFKKTNGDIIPIDGKMLKGSHDKKSDVHAINVVGAFSTANNILLGQVKTETKSNEIVAIPKLLQMLDIKNCIVSIDAIGCQTEIAKHIVNQGGDYVLAVKGNQPTLLNEIQESFDVLLEGQSKNVKFYETSEKGHGRSEVRRYYMSNDIDNLSKIDEFSGSSAIGMVESIRTQNDKTSIETRYYILSFLCSASLFATVVRQHWAIESAPQAHEKEVYVEHKPRACA